MGHRANYIVKSEEHYELYYSHWGANVVPSDLFWGPRAALEFVKSQRPTTEWLDDVWCEGGACLDLANRRLVFFGGEDEKYDPLLQAVVLAFFGHTWTDWTVEWALRGILDLARATGIDETTVTVRSPGPTCKEGRPKPEFVQKDRLWSECVLDVDGKLYSLVNPIDAVLSGGPDFLSSLPGKPPRLCLDSYPPRAGIMAWSEARLLHYWHAEPLEVPKENLEKQWSGWQLLYRPQLAVPEALRFLDKAGQTLPTWAETVKRFRSSVCRQIPSRALSLTGLQALHGPEADIQLNPLATDDVRPEVDEESARSLFDTIAARVVPLF